MKRPTPVAKAAPERPQRIMGKRAPRILFFASIASYLVSLCVPAFYDAKSPGPWLGITALIAGVFGLFDGFYCWLANPLMLAVWLLAAIQKKPALIGALVVCSAALAGALCLSFLRHHSISINTAGDKAAIEGLGPGFWLWCFSPLLMVVYGLVVLVRRNETWLDV